MTIEDKQCLRCGHKWIPRKHTEPVICPGCMSPYWNKPKGVKKDDAV